MPVRCVVIEDSNRVRELTCDLVTAFGFEATGVETAEAGVDLVREEVADVVLLDWDLPKLGALDFLSGLAQSTLERKPEVILMAAENEPQQFALARSAGATYYVLKPFDRADIAEVLTRAGFPPEVKVA